jgi:hypothetical protein
MIASNVVAHDTVHVFDRNKGFVHRPAGWAHAICFCTLCVLLCRESAFKNTATVYALIG